ncbi:hypothetical protein [Fretibacter rubidus]|uniref:hypothetical protein n=1 Tax=Fretibacter rubidus TaxID=570162 RepID=UPI00352B9C1D
MRFGLILLVMTSLSAQLAFAAPGDTLPRAKTQTEVSPQNFRSSPKGFGQTVATLPGLYAKTIATSLGDIAAIAVDDDGTVYTADQATGRIFALGDRGRDGRLDGRQLFASGFDRPSGLAYNNETLYIADRVAIWAVDIKTRTKSKLAPLSASGADAAPRPLALSNNNIIIGLSFTTAEKRHSRLISIDPQTGIASLVKQIDDAPLSTLAVQTSGQIWAGVGTQLIPIMAGDLAFPIISGAPITGLTFGSKDSFPSDWPEALRGRIYLSTGQSNTARGGFSILTLASEFGAPAASVEVFADGFYNARNQSLWGQPGALLPTANGLIMADRFGALWRIGLDDRPVQAPRRSISQPLPDLPVQKPSRPRGETTPMAGSQISGSTITTGSTIAVGSQLIKEFEEKEAAKKEAADKEAEEKAQAIDDAAKKNAPD